MRKSHFGLGISFREEAERVSRIKIEPEKRVGSDIENNEIKQVLFSCDQETGMPCGNLGSALKGQPLNVQQAILGQVSGSGTSGIDDPDVALEAVKLNNESDDAFNSRMQNLAQREIEKAKSKVKKS